MTRTVENALGKKAVYSFSKREASVKLIGVSGAASTNCPASTRALSYNADGGIAEKTDEEGRVTAYTYDSGGRVVSTTRGSGTAQAATTTTTWHTTFNAPTQVVEPGLTTDLTWNAAGQLTQLKQTDTTSHTVPFSTNGRTRIWAYAYGASGRLSSVDGPLAGTGDTTSYTYNANGYLATATNEVGHVTTVTAWNERGQPTSITDPNGLVTTYGYDGLGRVTSIIVNPGASQIPWTLTYTAAGDLATIQEPTGALHMLTWDNARRLTKIQNNLGETLNYTRNAMGEATSRIIKAADGTTVTYSETNTFDELNRLIKQVGGEGRTWKAGYDKTSNVTSVTDPRNKVLGYGYDAVSRLVTETERDTGVVTRTYNGKDEEVSYKDPRNLTTTYTRNGFGEVIQEVSPDRGTTVYDYDARGLMISKKDARNVTATYTYDNAGRLKTRSYPTTAMNETFTYDSVAGGNGGKGKLTSSTDAAGSTSYWWDVAHDRQTGEVRTIGTYGHTVSYTYSPEGRLLQLSYPSGRTIFYDYDAMGRVAAVHLRRTPASTLESIVTWTGYFPFGDLRGFAFANGLNLWSNRSLEYKLDGVFLTPAAGGAALIERYHWFGTGQTLLKLNNDAIASSETQTFTYDDAERMTSAVGPYGSRSWTYDKVGNRTGETKVVGGVTTAQTYTYPGTSNRLASITVGGTATRSFTYDAAGSTTGDTRSGTAYAMTINNAGRISQVTVGGSIKANYTYDHKNRLSIRQTLNMTPAGTTHFIYDKNDRLLAETNGAGTTVREYVWVGDTPVAVLDGSSTPANPTLLWVHADHLNRPELMTNASKTVVWKALYEPFGAVHAITGPATNNQRFPGQWFQLETGLHYNWWRHYDPSTGRYTQADPLAVGSPGVGPTLYAYAVSSPLMNVDPDGLSPKKIDPRNLIPGGSRPNPQSSIGGTDIDNPGRFVPKPPLDPGALPLPTPRRGGPVCPRWKVGDDINRRTAAGNDPAWSTIRRRFWRNEGNNPQYGPYSDSDAVRMNNGQPPQRYNPDKGGIESMELSHEPIPRRNGGVDVTPRWPQDHRAQDPYRRPGY